MWMHLSDEITNFRRDLEGASRHVKSSVGEKLIQSVTLLCAFERSYAPTNLLHKIFIPHDFQRFLPALVLILADNNCDWFSIAGDRYQLISALYGVHQFTELSLNLG